MVYILPFSSSSSPFFPSHFLSFFPLLFLVFIPSVDSVLTFPPPLSHIQSPCTHIQSLWLDLLFFSCRRRYLWQLSKGETGWRKKLFTSNIQNIFMPFRDWKGVEGAVFFWKTANKIIIMIPVVSKDFQSFMLLLLLLLLMMREWERNPAYVADPTDLLFPFLSCQHNSIFTIRSTLSLSANIQPAVHPKTLTHRLFS